MAKIKTAVDEVAGLLQGCAVAGDRAVESAKKLAPAPRPSGKSAETA